MRTDRHIEEIAAAHRPDPTQADLFNEWVTPSHVAWVEQAERAFRGRPADKLLAVMEALFETECWPVQYTSDAAHRCDFSQDAWKIVSVWLRARRAFEAKREQAA